ncbi:DUF4349 domain-containing protein [Streptosporangium sp. NPDC051022]|uniref:DUF4349 domain-containing protein n=1 Tax=Streptosporangium sp. NPDC051022 TaxID=3155752 RepID=UPI00341668FE
MRKLRYGLCAVGVALFVSSCGGTSSQSISDSGGAPVPAAAERAPMDAEAGSARAPKPRAADAQTGQRSQADQVKLVAQDRAIIYIAEMTVRAKDVTAAADSARRIVSTAGGYLATEKSDSRPGDEGSATLVFKIPPGGYPGLLDRLGRELGKRESLQQNTEDVTEQVADVESRLRSSKAALDSLRTLMKKAKTIGEVLDVEREISEREADLEALQSRQKTLASQTSMATLTLNLIGPEVTVETPEEEPAGFFGGLRSGWSAFVMAVKVGLTVLGVLLPWLVLVAVAWVLVVVVRRGRRRNRPAPGGRPTPGRTPAAPVPTAPVPAAPVPTAPVPAAPAPTAYPSPVAGPGDPKSADDGHDAGGDGGSDRARE